MFGGRQPLAGLLSLGRVGGVAGERLVWLRARLRCLRPAESGRAVLVLLLLLLLLLVLLLRDARTH